MRSRQSDQRLPRAAADLQHALSGPQLQRVLEARAPPALGRVQVGGTEAREVLEVGWIAEGLGHGRVR